MHKTSAVKVILETIRDNRERPPAYTVRDLARQIVSELEEEGYYIFRLPERAR